MNPITVDAFYDELRKIAFNVAEDIAGYRGRDFTAMPEAVRMQSIDRFMNMRNAGTVPDGSPAPNMNPETTVTARAPARAQTPAPNMRSEATVTARAPARAPAQAQAPVQAPVQAQAPAPNMRPEVTPSRPVYRLGDGAPNRVSGDLSHSSLVRSGMYEKVPTSSGVSQVTKTLPGAVAKKPGVLGAIGAAAKRIVPKMLKVGSEDLTIAEMRALLKLSAQTTG